MSASRPAACLAALLLGASLCAAQTFSGKASSWVRGEIRDGALPAENGTDHAMFLMGNTLLTMDYASPWLEARFAPQYFGVWGASANGTLAIDEAWFTLRSPAGFFARLGRQRLSYDDQRVIGADDWAMTAKTHDALKLGFEGGIHKVHVLLAFNQNNENLNGGTVYLNGGQTYKTMATLWYHADPLPWLGASLIGMDIGMQSLLLGDDSTLHQQLFGGFLDLHPGPFSLQASYYRQAGKNEYAMPIHAWMMSAESAWRANPRLKFTGGYFRLSGDPFYYVPHQGALGMARKTEIRGFNPIFGSHHKFYGAMDFFYVTTYYGGNSPGLQDAHAGVQWSPVEKLELLGSYHYLATSVSIEDVGRTLGHEFEFSLTWKLTSDVRLQAGCSFMNGTETMTRLKRTSDQNSLRWAWLMLTVSPELFQL